MAAQVNVPQKEDKTGKLLQIGGAVAGGILGGPAGIALGSQLGGMAGNLTAAERRAQQLQAGQSQAQVPTVQDPMSAIQEARIALASQPEDIQKEFGPTLQAAYLKARRGNGGVA